MLGDRLDDPTKHSLKTGNSSLDSGLYRYHQLVENGFARLKPYRAISKRYD